MNVLDFKKNICHLFKAKYTPHIATIIIGILICVNILGFVGTSLGGNYDWLMLPAKYFGMPNELAEYYNNQTLYNYNGGLGWDGQFYYYISNDILGVKGFSQFVDSPSYRWQRIGLPALAKVVSLLFLKENVSVSVFTGANLFIVLFGYFVTAQWFVKNKKNVLWIVPWVLSCGVLITIRQALPDAAADALFIVAFIMLLQKKYYIYSLFMTLTCLTREGYVLIAFFIFIAFILNKYDTWKFWDNKKIKFKHFIVIAFPGIIFVCWYLYVTIHFGVFPFKQAYNIQQFYMVGWFQYIIQRISENNMGEVAGLLLYGMLVISALGIAVNLGKKNFIYWTLIPYIILVSSFGSTVMQHWTGYLKGISILFLLIPFMIVQYEDFYIDIYRFNCGRRIVKIINLTQIIQTVMAIILSISLVVSGYAIKYWGQSILKDNYYYHSRETIENVQDITDYSCDFEVTNFEYEKYSKIPSAFVDDYAICSVRFRNNSKFPWSNLGDKSGRGAVKISYQIYQNGLIIQEGERYNLTSSVNPGEPEERELYITYPEKPGKYIVRVSLIQEGVNWFYNLGTGYMDISIEVK